MYSFDFVCLGAGGGPSETDLSAYLLKSSDTAWEDGIVALEAGSGIGALTQILTRNPGLFYDLKARNDIAEPPSILAARIYSYIQTFLISHSHLDHVLSLILSAGSLPPPPPLTVAPTSRRRIMGTKPVLDDLSTMIFSDRIWPNLASWSREPDVPGFMYLYEPVTVNHASTTTAVNNTVFEMDLTTHYHPINSKLSLFAVPISHGLCRSGGGSAPGSSGTSSKRTSVVANTYASTAFFLRHNTTQKQMLFFGDVEPDSLALNPSTKSVWTVAAPLIITPLLPPPPTSASSVPLLIPVSDGERTLDSIFIECSWPSSRKDNELYGHLNPQHLLHEMKVLATEIIRYQDTHPASPVSSPLSSSPPTSFPDVSKSHNSPPSPPNSPREPPKKKRRRTIKRPFHKASESNASASSTPKNLSTVALTSTSGSELNLNPNSSANANSNSNINGIHPDPSRLKGILKGVKLYVMHFKAPLQTCPGLKDGKLSQHIASELRELVAKEELGLEVIAVEQGMRIQI